MSLEENISHCFREYPKMKLRIEILETENQRLQAEVARLLDLTLQPRNLREQSLMIENMSIRRTATEAALRWGSENAWMVASKLHGADGFIARGLAALLGEGK